MSAEIGMEARHWLELAKRAAHRTPTFTRFLEPSAEREAVSMAGKAGVHAELWGGFDDAERRICAYYAEEAPSRDEYPIERIGVTWNEKFATAGHRDILGAVMGLGLERDGIGDVAMCREGACVFAHTDVAEYILGNLESAGRAHVRCKRLDVLPEILPPEGDTVRVTVNALRMDAIVAAGYRISRSEAQRLIDTGMVKRNHAEELRTDCRLEEGDLLSIRGFGRCKVQCVEGETKKGRLAVQLFQYGKK